MIFRIKVLLIKRKKAVTSFPFDEKEKRKKERKARKI